MNCPNCGAPLEDDARFCGSCGAKINVEVDPEAETDKAETAEAAVETGEPVTESATSAAGTDESAAGGDASAKREDANQAAAAAPPRSSAEEKSDSVFGSLAPYKIVLLVVGTVLIVIGIVKIFSSRSGLEDAAFGADFYTYVYEGVYAISKLLASIGRSIGWLLVAVGAVIDVSAIRRHD